MFFFIIKILCVPAAIDIRQIDNLEDVLLLENDIGDVSREKEA